MNIFVDVDGVVADLVPRWLMRYNEDYQDNVQESDLLEWDITKVVKPECGVKIFDYIEDPGLYNDVQPVPGAVEGVQGLRDRGFRVIFATSTPNGSAGAKLRWLLKWGFLSSENMKGTVHPDYIELNDKSLLRGDVMIDDAPHYVRNFDGYAILFDSPHNRNFDWEPRAQNWYQVLALLDQDVVPVGNHPVELHSPHQARAFKEITRKMYQVHLEKNMDYSPANILGTGYIGLVTRLWDKTARLLNLAGFKMTIALSEFTVPQDPKNESVDDTLLDMANYAIIGKLLRSDDWGH